MRSGAISIGLVGALAIGLTGCGSAGQSAPRRCIDQDSYVVVGDEQCLTPTPTAGGSGGRPYGWYYGGRVANGRISGGSFQGPSGVETGGFGASAKGKSGTGVGG